jgi:hypothetical protein
LESQPGNQLVLVRYSADHDALEQWVYNTANIDNSKVVWAWDMSRPENLELMRYYKDRKVWLVEPDSNPAKVSLYAAAMEEAAGISAPQ